MARKSISLSTVGKLKEFLSNFDDNARVLFDDCGDICSPFIFAAYKSSSEDSGEKVNNLVIKADF